ncbi:hypothetical protein DW785_13935 [Bacteroides xylanisolvens]|uniref:Uncharacterized protein n=1 Tax=Bacteroides xylanisolvens TaxID=371601 RepID=A0A414GBB1_9BACE|nr:hypothetical protein [Bacteroides sp.]MBV3839096.1 hypothetical protein [Bacteroides xylanisolvens]MBS5768975.1 hypothetical protein [Bacteroides sp.]RGI96425.1 hypothetical protein DXD80_13935 [Bacteroides xylanisolvens]RHD66144.1 hypothetical protein DW785_13935 [Bacteroides xylanisolvens]
MNFCICKFRYCHPSHIRRLSNCYCILYILFSITNNVIHRSCKIISSSTTNLCNSIYQDDITIIRSKASNKCTFVNKCRHSNLSSCRRQGSYIIF